MLKTLAQRKALSASDYLRQLLRREFLAEAVKWRRSLSRLELAVLEELADAGGGEPIGAIHAGLEQQPKKIGCSRAEVDLAVRGLGQAGLVERDTAASRGDATFSLTATGRHVVGRS